MRRHRIFALVAMLLAGCGGGDELEDLRKQVAAKEAEARALAVVSPCSENSQCSYLDFHPIDGQCFGGSALFSTASATAAQALAVTTEQVALAQQLRLVSPVAQPECPAQAQRLAPVCIANQCVPS